jgi:LacI family transcriptional regulator
MGITLKALSKITGYSMITISRAINYPHLLQKDTREKILSAIEKYRYTPNNVAKALVYQRTNIIHVYIPEDLSPTNQFVMQVIAGIGSYLGDNGYSILISKNWYKHQNVDGLIVMGLSLQDEERLHDLAKTKPLVLFGHDDAVDCVDVDNVNGMELATDHAIACGYEHIAFLGIAQDKKFTKDRYLGYEKSLLRHGRLVDADQVLFTDNNIDAAYKAGKKLLKEHPEIDCIVCSSDDMAIGVMQAAQNMNISIPIRLGVVGYDGLGVELLAHPKLTTIHQPVYEIGIELAKIVLMKIKDAISAATKTNFYAPILQVGATTAKR